MTMLGTPTPNGPIRTGYMLVDPSNTDDETFFDTVPMLACIPAPLSRSAQLMPRIIEVAGLSPAQQGSLGEILLRELSGERPPAICAWLDAAVDARALVQHINRFLVGPGAHGTAVYWRYFDPRVFALVLQVFSREQVQALLGPITEWRMPWCQRFWKASDPGQGIEPLQGITPAWPNEQQWRSLEVSAQISSVMAKLLDLLTSTRPVSHACCLYLFNKINAAMLDAQRGLHLHDHDELMEFAFHSVRYGEQFRNHPKMVSQWAALARGKIGWNEMISQLDQSDYQSLDSNFQSLLMVRGDIYDRL